MSEIKHIDYVGFTFNGKHSSELGIIRTSEGSRFNENLLPTIQDKVVQIPGADGMYHYGSQYTQRQFNISYAFDSLTEQQLQEIKRVFGDKKVHELIFDEAPYKVYKAKVTGTASIKHIPFSEGENNRIYKGEGSLQFTAYDPFGYCREKYLSNDYYKNYNNIMEWNDAANLLQSSTGYDTLSNQTINLYNPGIKEADFILTFSFNSKGVVPKGTIFIDANSQLSFEEIKRQGKDTHIKINTKLNLIEGYRRESQKGPDIKSGNVYNKHIIDGTFFKIPTNSMSSNIELTLTPYLTDIFDGIKYDYIYL